MAFPILSGQDTIYGRKPQTTWGTAVVTAFNTAASGFQFPAEPIDLSLGVKRREGKQAWGTRAQYNTSLQYDEKGVLPEFALSGVATKQTLAEIFYSIFQSVAEGASTPFSKTFNWHATQPDFHANAGFFETFALRFPSASTHHLVKDVITKSLTLTCKVSDGRLMYSAQMIGRGAVTVNNNIATSEFALRAETYLYYHDLVRTTINVNAAGVITLPILADGFEITIEKVVDGAGQSTGQFQSLATATYRVKGKLHIAKGATFETILTGFKSNHEVDINLAWGSGTAGTVDGDLDFTIHGKITDIKVDNKEVLGAEITFEGVKTASVQDVTVILADAVDRAW